jgi:hypothetical protein
MVERHTKVEEITMRADGSGQFREVYTIKDPETGDTLVTYDQYFQVPSTDMPPVPSPMGDGTIDGTKFREEYRAKRKEREEKEERERRKRGERTPRNSR